VFLKEIFQWIAKWSKRNERKRLFSDEVLVKSGTTPRLPDAV